MLLSSVTWFADVTKVCRSASLQVCKSASLQVCKSASLQVSHTEFSYHFARCKISGVVGVNGKRPLPTSERLQCLKETIKDVRAHCHCASLVRTLFIGHARATSFSSARTDSAKTQQNIERMTFALTWCANIFVGWSVTPTFFRQITSFSDSFHHTKKQTKSVFGKF